MAKSNQSETRRLAEKIGVSESTIRARRARGQDVTAPRQIRLTPAQMKKIAKDRDSTAAVARKFGVSISTVKRLRRVMGAKRPAGHKKKK